LKDEVYELVRPGADARTIDLAARRPGMTTMVEDAIAKCRAGITTMRPLALERVVPDSRLSRHR
jgi:general secretion pathway protein E